MTEAVTLTCEAVLFDMDGTLIDSTALVERLWLEFATEYAIDAAELIAFSHGRQTTATLRHYLPDATTKEIHALAQRLEHPDHELSGGVVAVPGALEFYRSVPAARRAIVTSARRDIAIPRLLRHGFELPEVFVTAGDTAASKPDPEPYRAAAAALGVAAERCVVCEDAVAGITAGLSAGAQVVVIGSTQPHQSAELLHLPDFTHCSPVTMRGAQLEWTVRR